MDRRDTNRWMDKPTERWMNYQTDRWMKQTHIDEQMDRCMNRQRQLDDC